LVFFEWGAPNQPACLPVSTNNVFFDANSGFTSGSQTVTINVPNAYCKNMNWTGAVNTPSLLPQVQAMS